MFQLAFVIRQFSLLQNQSSSTILFACAPGCPWSEKSQGKKKLFFSKTGDCQEILTSVGEFYIFSHKSGKKLGISKRKVYIKNNGSCLGLIII